MPTYPLKCPACGAKFEEFARMSEREAIKSPCCHAGPCESVVCLPRLRLPRVFVGSKRESMRYACHPTEVAEMRRLCPSATYDDDGRVFFEDSAAVDQFEKDKAKLRAQTRDEEARDAHEMQRCYDKGMVEEN